jgi:hypothetical protein
MNTNQQAQNKSGKRICAVWAKASEKVSRFYMGNFGDTRVLIMPNRFKTAENKQPDFHVYVEPKQRREGHRAFQVSIAGLWASKINQGEYRSDVRGRDWFSLRLIASKRKDSQPDAVIYLQ